MWKLGVYFFFVEKDSLTHLYPKAVRKKPLFLAPSFSYLFDYSEGRFLKLWLFEIALSSIRFSLGIASRLPAIEADRKKYLSGVVRTALN